MVHIHVIWIDLNPFTGQMMLCAKFNWNWPGGSREKFLISSWYFGYFVVISPWKTAQPLIWRNLIPSNQVCFAPGLVEIGQVVLAILITHLSFQLRRVQHLLEIGIVLYKTKIDLIALYELLAPVRKPLSPCQFEKKTSCVFSKQNLRWNAFAWERLAIIVKVTYSFAKVYQCALLQRTLNNYALWIFFPKVR